VTSKSKPLHLNPGRISEAGALEELTYSLIRLRAVIVRESVGVDSPTRKLGAIGRVLDQDSAAILKAMRAARARHNGVLAADDALRLAYAILLNVTLLNDWLLTAAAFKRLPSGLPGNRWLSEARTREERERRLAMVKGRSAVAIELIDDLERLALIDPGMGPNVTESIALLASLRIELRCNEINATVVVRHDGKNRYRLPDRELRLIRDELKDIASSDAFQRRNDNAKSAVWLSLAIVCSALGDVPGATEAVIKRKAVAGASPEDRIRAIADVLSVSNSDLDRLSLVAELEQLEKQGQLGPVYSRERLGKISILRDSFAALVRMANPTDAVGQALLQASFDCHGRWMFGISLPVDYAVIRITSSWRGEGRVFWRLSGDVKSRDFQLDPALVNGLILSRDSMSSNSSIWRRVLEHQDQVLSPLVAEALDDVPGARLEAIGLAAHLPLSLLSIDGTPIGTRDTFGYVHPRAGNSQSASESTKWRPDLMVVDHAFSGETQKVIQAARSAQTWASQTIEILEFNSYNQSEGLDRAQLLSHLARSRAAVFFCHGVSEMQNAAGVGLLIAKDDTLTVEEIAALDLRNLKDLALIACSSGRGNPFVGQVTIAHAMAVARAATIAFTYWPILKKDGARVAEMLLGEDASRLSLSTLIAHGVDPVNPSRAAFSIIRQ